MNRPSRNDETLDRPGWNQSPPHLSNDLTTRQDMNGMANLRRERENSARDRSASIDDPGDDRLDAGSMPPNEHAAPETGAKSSGKGGDEALAVIPATGPTSKPSEKSPSLSASPADRGRARTPTTPLGRWLAPLRKFAGFLGPGFMVAVAYIDPGNYATDAAAGAATRYRLLFVVLLANIFAVVLQSLAVRLGTVTGLNLAEHCRAELPRWLNVALYLVAEGAVIATDIAEVIGTAIALNLLFHLPLVAGCLLSLADVLLILFLYRPSGSLRSLRFFECFVVALVLAVVVCFCIQLSFVRDVPAVDVLRGYLPSAAVVQGNGIYLSCGILGATVMPHSLYLGSGIVQPRLRAFDDAHPADRPLPPMRQDSAASTVIGGAAPQASPSSKLADLDDADAPVPARYRPSLAAIQHCLRHSTVELILSLTIFALFVNSAILIVSGSSLYEPHPSDPAAASPGLFDIYDLLARDISRAAATVFAVALLCSGVSAGIVCTMAGQMICEGQLNWRMRPWLRRLLTRSLSAVPAAAVGSLAGREGLDKALTASQVALSVALPFVVGPLVYFTARGRIMTVGGGAKKKKGGSDGMAERAEGSGGLGKVMRSHRAVTLLAAMIWLVIVIMNITLVVFEAMGK